MRRALAKAKVRGLMLLLMIATPFITIAALIFDPASKGRRGETVRDGVAVFAEAARCFWSGERPHVTTP